MGAESQTTAQEVEELLRQGRALGLRLGGLPRLAAALDAAVAWEAAAQRALRPGTPLVSLQGLRFPWSRARLGGRCAARAARPAARHATGVLSGVKGSQGHGLAWEAAAQRALRPVTSQIYSQGFRVLWVRACLEAATQRGLRPCMSLVPSQGRVLGSRAHLGDRARCGACGQTRLWFLCRA